MSAPLLTDDEFEVMDLLSKAARKFRVIIGSGPQAESDWREAANTIHHLQRMILAQAAARAYPDRFRPLGGLVEPPAWKQSRS